jgi:heptosyltransferase III
MLNSIEHIIISRTDAIGDVMLTLPMAGFLKNKYPNLRVTFLGNTYTSPILKYCTAIDHIVELAELQKLDKADQITLIQNLKADAIVHVFPNKVVAKLAKQAGIKYRVGTTNRLYHWLYCNRLVRLSRKNSDLHEAELNLHLLKGVGLQDFPKKTEIYRYYALRIPNVDSTVAQYISKDKTNIILHTKSKGSAREWGLENFARLIQKLKPSAYQIILTGTEAEGHLFRANLLEPFDHVIDTSGKLSLEQLIQLISKHRAITYCIGSWEKSNRTLCTNAPALSTTLGTTGNARRCFSDKQKLQ